MLDSEGFVRAGWVHDLVLHKFSTTGNVMKFVVKGKVYSKNIYMAIQTHVLLPCFKIILQIKHSQCMAETPLLPWVILEQDGGILAAHCTCITG